MENLIDTIENALKKQDYKYSRLEESELDVSIPPNYNLTILLRNDYNILHFSNDLNIICPEDRLAVAEDSIIKVNERIWLGHFDLLSMDNRIVFSFSLPFADTIVLDEDYIEDILFMILDESDRFYHYFKMILSDKQIPNFSIGTLFKTAIGEA